MSTLAKLPDGETAKASLSALVTSYRIWIEQQRKNLPPVSARRKEVAAQLLDQATVAANRIEEGVAQLADPKAF